jgi:hypothetical protein
VALQRYQADPSEAADATPAAEQERWEAEQQKRTRLGGGNREVLAEAAAEAAAKYEMLFDDSIEYVKVRGCSRSTSVAQAQKLTSWAWWCVCVYASLYWPT